MTAVPEPVPAAYPDHWEADVVLRDGGTAHIRPIAPSDADRLRAFHRAQSPESIYLRFFAPYPELTDRDVDRFTHVDHDQRVALIATIGEDIVGVVRYDRIEPGEAEVAFNISDAHQGRGLGSVLLEHITAAARERGIVRFVADVLPINRKMLRVFQDAGYAVHSDLDDGVISLSFDILPTDGSLQVAQAREQRAEARSIQRLLTPRSVAVIGASRVYDSVGQTVLRALLADFQGEVYAVNPGVAEVAGLPAHRSVLDLPDPVDLAVVAVPVDAVLGVVMECATKGVRGVLILSAGYGTATEESRLRQQALVAVARANGLRIVGPNSFGMINTAAGVRLNASLAPSMPPRGRVGFFAQSGALSVAILEAAAHRGLGLSTFVSAGNRADVSGNDLLQYWDEDPDTEVVLLYLESIGNPRKFSRLARRTARSTPVVSVRTGRSTQGTPLGPTDRVSTIPAAAVDAMFRQAGVVRVDTLTQLLDVGQLLASQPLPAGNRIGIVGNSDALGLLAADACIEAGLHVVGTPVDLGAEATAEDFRRGLSEAFADPEVDAVVAVFIPPLLTRAEEVAAAVAETAAVGGKTVVSTFLGMRGVPEQLRVADVEGNMPGRGSVPSFGSPEGAVRALAAAVDYAAWRRRPAGQVPDLEVDEAGARAIVEKVLAAAPEGLWLRGPRLIKLLACYGIHLWPTLPVRDESELAVAAESVGYPVALKTTVPHLRQQFDLSDVHLNLHNEAQLRAAYRDLLDRHGLVAGDAMVVQPMATPGVPCLVGSVEDPFFGPVVSFGLGGISTELLGDRAYRIPPLTDADAHDLVRGVAAAPLLFGHRGDEPVDVAALEALALRVSRLADDLPEIAEMELNPVLVSTDGLAILHARLRLARPFVREDAGPRRLTG